VQSSSQIITTNKPTPSRFYRPDALPVPQPSVKALKGKYPMDSPGGLSTLSLAVNSS